ncbi:hypothetical protein BKA93DRAFT_748702 [Sparassis latifolia]
MTERSLQIDIFPPEMYDQIIDFLWYSWSTLAMCNATCHAWQPSARLDLFYSADLNSQSRYQLRERLVCTPSSSSVNIGYDVRELQIVGRFWLDVELPYGQLLAKLPNVEYLMLKVMSWTSAGLQEMKKSIVTISASMQSNSLDAVSLINTSPEMLSILWSPQLTLISLSSVEVMNFM